MKSAKIAPGEIDAQNAYGPLADLPIRFCCELRHPKANHLFIIAEHAAHLRPHRMNAASVMVHVIKQARAEKALLVRKRRTLFLRHGFDAFFDFFQFRFGHRNRSAAETSASLAR